MQIVILNRQVICAACALVASSLFAVSSYWGPESGNWHDPQAWNYDIRPQTMGDAAIFTYATQTGAVDVAFGGTDGAALYFNVNAETGVTDNNGPFVKNVFVNGGGATLNLGQGVSVGCRRKAVFEDMTIACNQTDPAAYFTINGKCVLRNASYTIPPDASGNYGGPVLAGSALVLDNGHVNIHASQIKAGKLTILNGGSFRYVRCWLTAQQMNAVEYDVVDGDVDHSYFDCTTLGFFPKRSGTFRSTANVKPLTSPDELNRSRLGGAAIITNATETGVSLYLTNNIALYGRGKLRVPMFSVSTGIAFVCDLSEVDLWDSRNLKVANCLWLGDTLFKPFVENTDWKNPSLVGEGAVNVFRGRNTFQVETDGGAARYWSVRPNDDCARNVAFVFTSASSAENRLTQYLYLNSSAPPATVSARLRLGRMRRFMPIFRTICKRGRTT